MMNELTYQPLDDSHAEGLLPIWSDEDVIKYTNILSPCSLEDVRSRINLLKESDVFIVVQNETIIGIVGCLCVDKERAQYGLFYQFRKSAWGKGNATVSTDWLLRFITNKYPDAVLLADVVADNVASEKILKKFGFIRLSEEAFERNGIKMQLHHYSKQ